MFQNKACTQSFSSNTPGWTALIGEEKGGKPQGSSSQPMLNNPPTHLTTPQCKCEAITAPFRMMAAGVKGDTSDSISPTGDANEPPSAF